MSQIESDAIEWGKCCDGGKFDEFNKKATVTPRLQMITCPAETALFKCNELLTVTQPAQLSESFL